MRTSDLCCLFDLIVPRGTGVAIAGEPMPKVFHVEQTGMAECNCGNNRILSFEMICSLAQAVTLIRGKIKIASYF
jgi:hypothetical protein